jgi:predicted GIY-YIG superfamily endonuclease
MSTQIWLYRYYDEFGRLLYIEITTKLKDRNRSHRKYSNWYVKSVTSTSECCSTYIEALAREKTAIKAEKPIYNITHNNNNPQRKQKEPSGILPNTLFLYHAYVERCLNAKNCINLMMNLSLPTNEYLRHMVNRREVKKSGKNLTITNDFVLFAQRKS